MQQVSNFSNQPHSQLQNGFMGRAERTESNNDQRDKSSEQRGLNNSRVSTPIRNQQ